MKNVPDYDVEHSEVLLYHVRILEELGQTTEALSFLDVNAKSRAIIDRTAIMQYRGELHHHAARRISNTFPTSPIIVQAQIGGC